MPHRLPKATQLDTTRSCNSNMETETAWVNIQKRESEAKLHVHQVSQVGQMVWHLLRKCKMLGSVPRSGWIFCLILLFFSTLIFNFSASSEPSFVYVPTSVHKQSWPEWRQRFSKTNKYCFESFCLFFINSRASVLEKQTVFGKAPWRQRVIVTNSMVIW